MKRNETRFWSTCKRLKTGGQGRNRTADASLFRADILQTQVRLMPAQPNWTLSCEALVRSGDESNAGGCGQVQAPPQLDHRANYESLLDALVPWLAGEFQPADGICFPKVDARPKPVVIIIAGLEWIAA